MPRKEREKICNYCKKFFMTRNPWVRFCSHKCSGVATYKPRIISDEECKQRSERVKRSMIEHPEIKNKISESLKKYWAEHPEKIKKGKERSLSAAKASKGKYRKRPPKSILELSLRTVSKIFKRLNVGCSRCGWNESSGDLHHINGRKIENANCHDNLTYLCPNCHRLIGNKKIPKEQLINLTKFIGDKWKDVYYG